MTFSCKPVMTSWWYPRYRGRRTQFSMVDSARACDPKFIVMLYWHVLPIFNRLRVRLFHFGWDFPILPAKICGVFGENDPKKSKFRKTIAHRALPHVKPRLLSYCAWESVHGFGLYAWQGKKKNNNKRLATRIVHYHVGAPPLIRFQPNLAGLLIRRTLSILLSLKLNDS